MDLSELGSSRTNVLEMKSLRSLVGVSRMDRVRNVKRCVGELE